MRWTQAIAAGAAGAAAMLAGCATMPGGDATPGAPRAIEAESIAFETSPCFGACPVYTVIVQPDGRGTFEGKRFTKVTGVREFDAGADGYRRFAAALAPYRPEVERLWQPGKPGCEMAPTDMPGVDVRWSEASGGSQHLTFYYGCAREQPAMAAALRAAPDLLPIGDLIGKR
jgi:hypothetical protein